MELCFRVLMGWMGGLSKVCPHPQTCECELLWKKRLCICDQVKDLQMRSPWIIQVDPISSDKRSCERHTEGKMQRRRQRLEGCRLKLRNAWSHQKLEEAKQGIPPRISGVNLQLCWLWTCSLRGSERINFSCFIKLFLANHYSVLGNSYKG